MFSQRSVTAWITSIVSIVLAASFLLMWTQKRSALAEVVSNASVKQHETLTIQSQLDVATANLQSVRADLAASKMEVSNTKLQLTSNQTQLNAANQELNDLRAQVSNNKQSETSLT